MRNRFSSSAGSVCLSLTLFATFQSYADAQVRVQVSSPSAAVGQTVEVNIDILTSVDARGFIFCLQYDPSILSPVAPKPWTPGSFWQSAMDTYGNFELFNTQVAENTICYASILSYGSASGTGTIAVAHFTVIAGGTSPLTVLTGPGMGIIDAATVKFLPMSVTNGMFTSTSSEPIHSISVDSVTTVGSAMVGSTVALSAHCTNGGNVSEDILVDFFANNTCCATTPATLPPGTTSEIGAAWNTSGWAVTDYIISAAVTLVSGAANTGTGTGTSDIVTSLTAIPSVSLGKRKAWPEHMHYAIDKDEDAYQSLYGAVYNLGAVDVTVRTRYTIFRNGAPWTVVVSDSVLLGTVPAPGESDPEGHAWGLRANVLTTAQLNAVEAGEAVYDVTAVAEMLLPTGWQTSGEERRFRFRISAK